MSPNTPPKVDYTDSIAYKKRYFLDNSLLMDVPANWIIFPQVIENRCFFPFHQSEIVSKPNAAGAIIVSKYKYEEKEGKPAFMFINKINENVLYEITDIAAKIKVSVELKENTNK